MTPCQIFAIFRSICARNWGFLGPKLEVTPVVSGFWDKVMDRMRIRPLLPPNFIEYFRYNNIRHATGWNTRHSILRKTFTEHLKQCITAMSSPYLWNCVPPTQFFKYLLLTSHDDPNPAHCLSTWMIQLSSEKKFARCDWKCLSEVILLKADYILWSV